jgi:hypothetical protein
MNENWDKNSSSEFIKKPGKGWLHSDLAVQEGISYNVKVSLIVFDLFNFVDVC